MAWAVLPRELAVGECVDMITAMPRLSGIYNRICHGFFRKARVIVWCLSWPNIQGRRGEISSFEMSVTEVKKKKTLGLASLSWYLIHNNYLLTTP